MLVAYTVNHREIGQAEELAKWIVELGGIKNHDCLLCLTRPARRFGAEEKLKPILEKAFKSVTVYEPWDEVEIPWPNETNDASSPNHFFKRVSKYIEASVKRPWLWMEMDAVPLKPMWLDALEAEYETAKKPFLGVRLQIGNISYMSGVAVYPPNIGCITPLLQNAGKNSFDVYAGRHTVSMMHNTQLIQYVKPNPDGPADWSVFHEPMQDDAVLYHRSKDLTLIDFLKNSKPDTKLSVENLVTGHGDAGEPHTGCSFPIETPEDQSPHQETITEEIRRLSGRLLEIANSNPGRRAMVIKELRKCRLRR